MKYKHAHDSGSITLAPLTIPCCIHPEARTNLMTFRFQDTSVFVSEGDTKLGSVEAGIGCSVDLNDEATGMTFRISGKQLWEVFAVAVKTHPDYQRLVAERKKKIKQAA